jgi:raffinose/stachyose/melibiose transport system substrate-binding protein
VAPIGVPGLTDADGKLVAPSVGSTFSGSVWINSKLFDKYKLSPPKTMDEWKKVCDVFKENKVTCFVQGAAQTAFNRDTMQAIADSIQPGYWTKASTGDAKWTDPVMVQTLERWKSLFTDGIMQPGALGTQQYPDANNAFMSQKAAMVMMGTWYMQNTTTAGIKASISAAGVANPEPFPIVPIPFPGGDGKYHLAGDSDFGIAVNSKSKAKDAAATFSVWLGTSKAGQQKVADILNDLPALNGVTPNWDAIKMPDTKVERPPLEALIKEASAVTEPRLGLIGVDLGTAIGVASTTVAEGKATPEAAAQTLQKAAEDAGITFK